MEDLVTVFTPVYNRAHTIEQLYQSLLKQTDLYFEWLVIDDGSEDGIASMIQQWIQGKDSPFVIRFYQQKNGGKHRAINRGVQLAKGEAFFIVDSDDYLTEDAIWQIRKWWKTISESCGFAGVSGLRGTENGKIIGDTPLFGSFADATNLERAKYGLLGDKAEVYKTSILKKYPFPEYEGENFLTEAVVWDKIARDGLNIRWFNQVIMICEYREDGLTMQGKELFIKNPKGWGLYLNQICEFFQLPLSKKIELYFEYYINLKDKIITREIQRNLWIDEKTMSEVEQLYSSCIKETINKIGRKVALYGAGNRGKSILALYKDSEVKVSYVLDRKETDLPYLQVGLYESYPPVDAIIVTPMHGQDEIVDFLRKHTGNRLIRYDEWAMLIAGVNL